MTNGYTMYVDRYDWKRPEEYAVTVADAENYLCSTAHTTGVFETKRMMADARRLPPNCASIPPQRELGKLDNKGRMQLSGKELVEAMEKAHPEWCKAQREGQTQTKVAADKEDVAPALKAYERRDYATALRLWRPLADQGNVFAQTGLGNMYAEGEGVAQDYANAMNWYRKAAERGYVAAQRRLGLMYADGQGVAQDLDKAMQWIAKAANQGDMVAQRRLGLMYAEGQGVAEDLEKAMQWFSKAAAQGDSKAQVFLGGIYLEGFGVPRNYVEAYKWFDVALSWIAVSGATGATIREKVTTSRDAVAAKMTPAQIAEAQKLAHEWKPRRV